MTVVDYYFLTGNKPNATVMVDVDRQDLSICWRNGCNTTHKAQSRIQG